MYRRSFTRIWLGCFFNQDNFEAAMEVLSRAKRIFPDSAATVVLLSNVYSLIGEEWRGFQEVESFLLHAAR